MPDESTSDWHLSPETGWPSYDEVLAARDNVAQWLTQAETLLAMLREDDRKLQQGVIKQTVAEKMSQPMLAVSIENDMAETRIRREVASGLLLELTGLAEQAKAEALIADTTWAIELSHDMEKNWRQVRMLYEVGEQTMQPVDLAQAQGKELQLRLEFTWLVTQSVQRLAAARGMVPPEST